MPKKRKTPMAKKSRSTSKRSSSSSKKSSSLKIRRRFSVFQVVIAAVVIALVGIVGAQYTGGDSSSALSLSGITTQRAGLTGYTSTGSTSNLSVGTITLSGANLRSATTVQI